MIRPRLALAMLLVGLFGLVASADAAEPATILFAQSPKMNELRGPGFYLNLFKFLPVFAIYLLWVKTTDWVDDDTRQLGNLRFEMWNSVVFFTGILGLAMVWAIPIYFVGLLLLLLLYFVPILTYAYSRNQTVDDQEKVLTAYHLGQVMNGLMNKAGMKGIFNKNVKAVDKSGPPIVFIAKSSGGKADPELLAKAEESKSFISCKELIYDAVIRRASDIHLEPTADQLTVRYRIDGAPLSAEPFDRPTGDGMVSVFKMLAAMDVAEKRKPQDGSFAAKLEAREVDLRVATSGSKAGEKMVIRILDNASTVSKLEEIGLRPKLVGEVRSLVTQPEGLFLSAGPPGSGRTTTLYAAVREIDRFQKNVVTLEDPIEFRLDNVTQKQVDTKAGETFSTKLRSLLREEPDVVMIGEIRDQETATIACQAASSRMVFSSVQAPDAVKALFRLLDLGVEPLMIASGLTAVLAQRLVRVLCEACKEPYKPKPEFLKKNNLPVDKVDVFYRKPTEPEEVCPQCGGLGYIGRTGIFELLVINDAIRAMIRANPSENAIKAEARKSGMIYLQEDGLRQVIQGKTSIDELLRVMK